MSNGSSWFQRFLLPGFAFKAVVIGGGYATGRELAEYFMPSGPWGGLAAMVMATVVWSIICAATFAYAHTMRTYDYNSFFSRLLGPAWAIFEVAYFMVVIVVLAVFGAVAGAIGNAVFGWPNLVGALLLAGAILAFVSYGNSAVEALFKYVTFLLYGVYALFLVLALSGFGDRIAENFSSAPMNGSWVVPGLTYAGYNIIGALVILPVMRHMTSRRDAVVSGLIAGPLAMLPAILFFVAMVGFYPSIADKTLPSDFLLRQLDIPAFHLLFQLMIFSAVLESGAGSVHAINERIAVAWQARKGQPLSRRHRAAISVGLLAACIFLADRIGLVGLIASGYRIVAYVFLLVYVLPLLTIGLIQLRRCSGSPVAEAVASPSV